MRRRRPRAALSVAAEPVVHAGSATTVTVDAPARLALRLLGWDMRRARKWPLGDVEAGSHQVELPAGLAPGCARMTEYAIFAELVGQRVAVAEPVRLVSDHVFVLEGPAGEGDGLALDADVVAIGGTVSGRSHAGTVEIGAELHDLAATVAPRFLAAATATTADGRFTATLPRDIPPTLADGEDLAIVWTVRAGDAWRRFAVVDPEGIAGERRPPLLTFLAQLARDPFALG